MDVGSLAASEMHNPCCFAECEPGCRTAAEERAARAAEAVEAVEVLVRRCNTTAEQASVQAESSCIAGIALAEVASESVGRDIARGIAG